MTEHWHLSDADPKRILFVGRFDRHKGGDLIIDALGRYWHRFLTPASGSSDPTADTSMPMAAPGTSRSTSAIEFRVPWK